MDNQHRKIAGYRELSQEEIELMNRIKAAGKALVDLHDELLRYHMAARHEKYQAAERVDTGVYHDEGQIAEYERFNLAEPERWAEIGKTNIQQGVMALVRSVAQPSEC